MVVREIKVCDHAFMTREILKRKPIRGRGVELGARGDVSLRGVPVLTAINSDSNRVNERAKGEDRNIEDERYWKFLNSGLKSAWNGESWRIGEWKHIANKRNVKLGDNGYHASKEPLVALKYVEGEIIAQVEGSGQTDIGDDKAAFHSMRIIRAWHWKEEDLAALTIYSAKLVLPYYEKRYPNDNQPANAIKTAEKYLKNPTKENARAASDARRAVRAASDAAIYATYNITRAGAGYAIINAAAYAAYAAYAAAYPYNASYPVVFAAIYAADGASAIAYTGNRTAYVSPITEKINKWIKRRVKTLEPYKEIGR